MSDAELSAALALLEQDKQARAVAATQAIKDVLQEHGCELVALPQITEDGRIVAQVRIVAR